MALISRTIPNLINGISQQPPTMRHSSQGEVQENAYSTVERGLGKRPPTEHVASLGLADIDVVYVASGASWEASETVIPFKSQDHQTVVLNGVIYVTGGFYTAPLNTVWKSTDGTTWTQATGSAPWQARWGHVSLVFDDKIWVMGGWYDTYPSHMLNDVWYSSDGSTWTQATAAADWPVRAAMMGCVYDGRMWIMGGSSNLVGVVEPVNVGLGTLYNDAWWSADGVTWTQAATQDPTDVTRWSPRSSSQLVSHLGLMWVLGGKTLGGYANDVWYSADGTTWVVATGGADWQGRYEHAALSYNNKLWILGGRRVQGGYITEGQQYRDVWNSEDGISWTQVTASAEWGYRDEHTATVFNDTIMVINGWTDPIPGAFPNDQTRGSTLFAIRDTVDTATGHVTDGGVVDFNMLPIATKDAFVHFINRDDNEQYVLLIADGTIGVWDLHTGIAKDMTAVNGLSYLVAGTPRESFAVLTVADVTFIVNKTITPIMSTAVGAGTLTGSVQSFSLLPGSPTTGQIYKISGTGGTDLDDWYVRYDGEVWVETVKPGLHNVFNDATLPHRLTRNADGTFTFAPIDWIDRLTGDTVSNPPPSFIDGRINDVFFYRNRLGFIADEDVILSRAGDFFNFWAESARAVVDSDPVDVGVSSAKVSILNYAVPFDKALLLFSNQTQFQMTGGDNLTPKTVRIDPTTSFEASIKCRPVGVGPDVYFPTPAGTYTRVREYFVQPQSLVNDAADVTAHVATYVPKNLFRMAGGANENLLLCLNLQERNRMHVYKFYWGDKDQKVQSSWSRWTFADGDTILGCDIFNNVVYMITLRENDLYIDKMNLETRINTGNLDFRVYLDRFTSMQGVYDPDTEFTTWTLPYPAEDFTVLNQDGSELTVDVDSDTQASLIGDYSSDPVYVGVPYEFRYRFSPQFHRDQGDVVILTQDLQLRTMRLAVEDTGAFEMEVTPKGRTTYVTPFLGVEQGLPAPTAAVPSILAEGMVRFGVLSKNTDVTIELVNGHYTPCWFQSAEWEGMFTLRSTHTAGK